MSLAMMRRIIWMSHTGLPVAVHTRSVEAARYCVEPKPVRGHAEDLLHYPHLQLVNE